MVKYFKWARHKGGKWHRIRDDFPEGSIGMITPLCYPYGNALKFPSDSPRTRLSESVPPNRTRRRWRREWNHLCLHCVIAATGRGERLED